MLITPTRTDKTGLRFLQWYPKHNVFHPGVDFNWGDGNDDFGQEVVSPTWGVCEYVSPIGTNGGLGNYLVLCHPQLGVWTRYLHLESIGVAVGQHIAPGQVIALLGDSGTEYAHLHFEVLNEKGRDWIQEGERPYGSYPRGLSKQKVASMFLDPVAWLRDTMQPQMDEMQELRKKLDAYENALRWAKGTRRNAILRAITRILDKLKGKPIP